MPRPLPFGCNPSFPPSAVLSRAECAKLLGAISAEWSNTEQLLAYIYGMLLGGPAIVGFSIHPAKWIAMEGFDMINALPQRIKMLKKAAERRGFDKDTLERFSDHLKTIQSAHDKRIISAHGRWGIHHKYPDCIIWQRNIAGREEALLYNAKDLSDLLDFVVDARQNLDVFYVAKLLPTLEAFEQQLIVDIAAAKNSQDGI